MIELSKYTFSLIDVNKFSKSLARKISGSGVSGNIFLLTLFSTFSHICKRLFRLHFERSDTGVITDASERTDTK